MLVFVSLAQLIGTMHNICKVQGSNSDHYQKEKKIIYNAYLIATFTRARFSHSITEFHIFKYFKNDIH